MINEQILSIIPDKELLFEGYENYVVKQILTIKNPTNEIICFKVKTTAPRIYSVRPNQGVILPHKALIINITKYPVDLDTHSKNRIHKFMIQSVVINDIYDSENSRIWNDHDAVMSTRIMSIRKILPKPEVEPEEENDSETVTSNHQVEVKNDVIKDYEQGDTVVKKKEVTIQKSVVDEKGDQIVPLEGQLVSAEDKFESIQDTMVDEDATTSEFDVTDYAGDDRPIRPMKDSYQDLAERSLSENSLTEGEIDDIVKIVSKNNSPISDRELSMNSKNNTILAAQLSPSLPELDSDDDSESQEAAVIASVVNEIYEEKGDESPAVVIDDTIPLRKSIKGELLIDADNSGINAGVMQEEGDEEDDDDYETESEDDTEDDDDMLSEDDQVISELLDELFANKMLNTKERNDIREIILQHTKDEVSSICEIRSRKLMCGTLLIGIGLGIGISYFSF